MFTFLANAAVTLAIFYNIHQSLKNKTKESKRYYKHYFTVIALLLSLDKTFSFILYRIPYYNFIKLLTLLWFSVPQSTGPRFVFNVYIKNIYQLFEGDIDSVINNIKGYVENIKNRYYEVVNKAKKGSSVEIGFKEDKIKSKTLSHQNSEEEPTSSGVDESDLIEEQVK